MNLLTTSWRHSLAAAALAALFTTDAPFTVADEPADVPADEAVVIETDRDITLVAYNEEDEAKEHEHQLREAFQALDEKMHDLQRNYRRKRAQLESMNICPIILIDSVCALAGRNVEFKYCWPMSG